MAPLWRAPLTSNLLFSSIHYSTLFCPFSSGSTRSDFNAVGVGAAKRFSVLAGIGTINHTRITGLVVFRYRVSSTNAIVARLVIFSSQWKWHIHSLLLYLGHSEDTTPTHCTLMVLLSEQYIHQDLPLR